MPTPYWPRPGCAPFTRWESYLSSPVITSGALAIAKSGAIIESLIERYG